MNKIIVDKENNIDIKDNAIILDILVNELTINIEGKVLIQEINKKENENLKLTINMKPNSSLVYNRFMIHNKMDDTIILNQQNKSNLSFNYSFISYDKCKIDFQSNLTSDDNETKIKVAAVTLDKGSTIISSTANTLPKIKNNNLIESIKVLVLNNEESRCIPNLLVASNEIEVNHAATISNIDKDYLFYLNSKGISINSAIDLIKTGYLLSNLEINEKINKQIRKFLGV